METNRRFSEWIGNIAKTENPPTLVQGFYFGIFESAEGYTMYLVGTDCFDEEDEDWATEVVFEPADKYFVLDKDVLQSKNWEQVLEKVEKLLHNYVNSDAFQASFLKKAQGKATGFDDGNLSIIYKG
jgi:hypothetical protein